MYDNEHSQVRSFAKNEEYSGKTIRIKVARPYFMNKGMALPRVESQAAHFAKVEILDEEGNWNNLD